MRPSRRASVRSRADQRQQQFQFRSVLAPGQRQAKGMEERAPLAAAGRLQRGDPGIPGRVIPGLFRQQRGRLVGELAILDQRLRCAAHDGPPVAGVVENAEVAAHGRPERRSAVDAALLQARGDAVVRQHVQQLGVQAAQLVGIETRGRGRYLVEGEPARQLVEASTALPPDRTCRASPWSSDVIAIGSKPPSRRLLNRQRAQPLRQPLAIRADQQRLCCPISGGSAPNARKISICAPGLVT